MLPHGATYDEIVSAFRWTVPTHYNMGVDACEKWAAAEPDRLAILHHRADGSTDRWSYDRLSKAAHRLANVLSAAGVVRGDRVAILLPQSPETATTHVAVYLMGAVALPLADLFGVEALTHRLPRLARTTGYGGRAAPRSGHGAGAHAEGLPRRSPARNPASLPPARGVRFGNRNRFTPTVGQRTPRTPTKWRSPA